MVAQADEGPSPQQHSAESCGENAQCLRLWYAEYKDGIIQEVLFWREFEDDVASHNENAAEADLGFAFADISTGIIIGTSIKGISLKGSADRSLRP
jgi:hypothetical protein